MVGFYKRRDRKKNKLELDDISVDDVGDVNIQGQDFRWGVAGFGDIISLGGPYVLTVWDDGVCEVRHVDSEGKAIPSRVKTTNQTAIIGQHRIRCLGGVVVASVWVKAVATMNVVSGETVHDMSFDNTDGVKYDSCGALGEDKILFLTSEGELRIYSHTRGANILEHCVKKVGKKLVGSMHLVTDGQGAVVYDSQCNLAEIWGSKWEADTPRTKVGFRIPPEVSACALSSKFVVFASPRGHISVRKTNGDRVGILKVCSETVVVELVGDSLLVVLSLDGVVRFIDLSQKPEMTACVRVTGDDNCSLSDSRLVFFSDGRVAVAAPGDLHLYTFRAPTAVEDRVKRHAILRVPPELETATALTPFLDTFQEVMDGCKELVDVDWKLLTHENNPSSLQEWVCAHCLLMAAVDHGHIPGNTEFEGQQAHWFQKIYCHVCCMVDSDECKNYVLALCSQAIQAGVIKSSSKYAIIFGITTANFTKERERSIRCDQLSLQQTMVEFLRHQSLVSTELEQVKSELKTAGRAQTISFLFSVVFSVIPFGSAVAVGAVAASGPFLDLVPAIAGVLHGILTGVTPVVLQGKRRSKNLISDDDFDTLPENLRQWLKNSSKLLDEALRVSQENTTNGSVRSILEVFQNCPEDLPSGQDAGSRIQTPQRQLSRSDTEMSRADEISLDELADLAYDHKRVEELRTVDTARLLSFAMVGFDKDLEEHREALERCLLCVVKKTARSGFALVRLDSGTNLDRIVTELSRSNLYNSHPSKDVFEGHLGWYLGKIRQLFLRDHEAPSVISRSRST